MYTGAKPQAESRYDTERTIYSILRIKNLQYHTDAEPNNKFIKSLSAGSGNFLALALRVKK